MQTPFDLHVLGTPPAFILSQDQTLKLKCSFNRQNLHWLSFMKIHQNFRGCFTVQLSRFLAKIICFKYLPAFIFRCRQECILALSTHYVNHFFILFFNFRYKSYSVAALCQRHMFILLQKPNYVNTKLH